MLEGICDSVHPVADSVLDPFLALGACERGFILAAFRGKPSNGVVRPLPLHSGDRCKSAYLAIAALPTAERDALFSQWMGELNAPLPIGLETLHPSWIEAAIEGEPPALLRAVAADLPGSLQSIVEAYWLAKEGKKTAAAGDAANLTSYQKIEILRLLFHPLEMLLPVEVGKQAEAICALDADQRMFQLMQSGAETVGRSLSGAPPGMRAKAMARVGEPWAKVIGTISNEAISAEARWAASQHAALRLPPSATRPQDRLLHIGLSVLRDALLEEGMSSMFKVAGRLPYAVAGPWLGARFRGW